MSVLDLRPRHQLLGGDPAPVQGAPLQLRGGCQRQPRGAGGQGRGQPASRTGSVVRNLFL